MKNAVNERGNKAIYKLFNFRPALFAAFFLVLGIVFGYYRFLYGASFLWLLLYMPVILLTLGFSSSLDVLFKRAVILAALTIFFLAGLIGFRSQVYDFRDCTPYEGEVTVVGTVESRVENEYGIRLVLRDITIDQTREEGKLNAYLPRSFGTTYAVADKVILRGKIHTDTSLIGEYGFRDSNVDNKLVYTLSADFCEKVGRSKNVFLRIRARIEKVAYAGMDETPAGLTLALLTGDTVGIEENLMDNMRYGGISHIFAVSGLNVGALFAFCLLLFRKTFLNKLSKPSRFLLLVGILFLYSGICSFTPSVVRAAVLCAVGYLITLFGSNADMLNGLGVAAIFILLITPVQLFNVGFQLSFLACFGLVLLTKPIGQVFDECEKIYRKYFPRRLRADEKASILKGDTIPPSIGERIWRSCATLLSASVAAQIATLPALFLHFGYVSGWSLLLNFIFVPVIDGIFTILLVFVLACCVLPTVVSTLALYLPSVVWSAIMLLFEVADFSTFRIDGVQLSFSICVFYYGGVLFSSDKCNLSRQTRRWLAIACFAVSGIGILCKALL